MDTLFDYLKWRGDLSFNKVEINEIDLGIFSILSYNDYLEELILEDNFISYSLKELVKIMADKNLMFLDKDNPQFKIQCLDLLSLISTKKRYQDVRIFGYSNNFESQNDLQFAAVSFILPTGDIIISYRGTDASLIGWKEDFMMSFKKSVGAQECGKLYLDKISSLTDNDIILVGHSKGGNIALYSAMMSSKGIHKRIKLVYSFDGPGFNEKTLLDFKESDIKDRMKTLVPQGSVIGILMQHEEPIEIIYSNKGNGASQHMIFSWEVQIDKFKRHEKRDTTSLIFDKSIRSWLTKLDENEMEQFIESTFEITNSIGLKDFIGMKKKPFQTIYSLINTFSKSNKDSRKLMDKVLTKLFISMKEATSAEINASKELFIEEFTDEKDKIINQLKNLKVR